MDYYSVNHSHCVWRTPANQDNKKWELNIEEYEGKKNMQLYKSDNIYSNKLK